MFRRARFRRPGPRQALITANRLKDNQEYEKAAQIFERLAKGAQERGMHKRAPFLYIQAAHCRLLALQPERGVGLLSQGLRLLEESQQWPALHRSGTAAVEELTRLGQIQAAEKVQSWLDQVLKDHPEAEKSSFEHLSTSVKSPPKLPAKCPYCGASIRPDQVEWITENSAECLYCGSAVQAED